MSARILTANRLRDGAAVFLAADGTWGTGLDVVRVVRDAEEAAALEAIGARDAAARIVVAPYLIDVVETDGRIVPTRFRERIRAFGPSINVASRRQAFAG